MPAPPPPPAPLAAPLVALLAALALAGFPSAETALTETRRAVRSQGAPVLPPGCLYEGRWFTDGGSVPTGEACLQCACHRGALSCRRRACAALPDPPPHRCHVLHRRGSCCPELHCPDGITLMEHGATSRLENEDITAPASSAHACVEGGTVYAAGSAMRAAAACEQCFCLGGGRRCVRPACLPPPPGCQPRPAPGACCPQRYYCEHRTKKPPEEKHPHDCKVDGKWIGEGERVVSQRMSSNCTQCFCLRGAVQCQPLACAPALLGCQPLLRPGECCAHQYHCQRHQDAAVSHLVALSNKLFTSARNDDQASPNTSPNKKETTTKTTLASIYLVKNTRITSATNNLVSTTKVKRKTSDPPPPEAASPPSQNSTEVATTKTAEEPSTTAKIITNTTTITTTEATSTTELTTETTSTEQPEGSVRIMINGTINCTAELSSTSLPLNVTFNDTDKMEKITMESHPRVPLIDVTNLEDHTFSPNDIITERDPNEGFDENESFVINVTSSLRTNNSQTLTKPPNIKPTPIVTKVSLPTDIVEVLNSSKKTKGDYDYDYTEPTLPPSLPNLKIIPFVAADAVVENERPKDTLTYPIHEREDKFPVYYAAINTQQESAFVTRREDVYHSTQYPVFITDKGDQDQYPSLSQDADLTSTGYSNVNNDLDKSSNEYTVSASLGSRISDYKNAVTQQPTASTTTFKLEIPAVNLFSPPVETEGGFVPKGPSGLIDEYYAVFPSTPSGPAVPHLTTSMQLDVGKGECVSGDGRHIPEGDSVTLACSECTCAWGKLHCSPRPCHTPPGCTRRPASSNSADLCCGELLCDEDNKPSHVPDTSTVKSTSTENITWNNKTDTIKNITYDRNDEPFLNTSKVHTGAPHGVPKNVTKSDSTNVKVEMPENQSTTISTTESETMMYTKQTETTTTPTRTTITSEEPEQMEYEEEEDDEGFSFGNVLKLLLSGDSYETTTTVSKRLPTTSSAAPIKVATTTRMPRPTLPPAPRPTAAPFVPMPLHPYIPPKISQNAINRIDHLVLGEATAIKRSTLRPATSPRPTSTKRPAMRTTTQRITTKPTEMTIKEEQTTQENPRPPGDLPGIGGGLLKLAGCNIYGRMYRVGRIIAELSTPCQECWCMESGVQCKQLKC